MVFGRGVPKPYEERAAWFLQMFCNVIVLNIVVWTAAAACRPLSGDPLYVLAAPQPRKGPKRASANDNGALPSIKAVVPPRAATPAFPQQLTLS